MPVCMHARACALYMSVSMWVHVCMCLCTWMSEEQIRCLSLSLCIIPRRQGLLLTWPPASLRSSCMCPLPPHSTGSQAHGMPSPLNVDVEIQTQNLKLVQQACLSWIYLFSPLKHYVNTPSGVSFSSGRIILDSVLEVHYMGKYWNTFCVNVDMEFRNNTSLSLLLCCMNKKPKPKGTKLHSMFKKFKMYGAHWFLYIHLLYIFWRCRYFTVFLRLRSETIQRQKRKP